jgi:hypothetical protein
MHDVARYLGSSTVHMPDGLCERAPLVVQPPSAEAILARDCPELALAAMQQVIGQNVANMAMASGCARTGLSEIQITSSKSWFGSSRTTTIRFRR